MYYLIDKSIIKKLDSRHLLESLSNINTNDDYFFYAYTNKKKVAKKFEKMRNMEKFILKVIDMEDYEYEELSKRCYSFQELILTPLLYRKNTRITIPITSGERWYCVENTFESFDSYKSDIFVLPFSLLTEELRLILLRLGYYDGQPDNVYPEIEEAYYSGDPVREYFDACTEENQFGLFLLLYSDLIIIEKVIMEGKYE